MIRCVIIDDEPLARELLKNYLNGLESIEIVGAYGDGFEGLKGIAEQKPDLIFLDIQMPKINGFEMLELLEDPPLVIFTTAYDEFALKAFEIHAVDYLLKPFSTDRLREAVDRVVRLSPAEMGRKTRLMLNDSFSEKEYLQRVVVKTGNKIAIIPVSQVEYIAADGDYVKIHSEGKGYLKLGTLAYYEKALDPSEFVRIHRSHIINLAEITKIEAYQKDSSVTILKGGTKLPLSKAGMVKLKTVLGI
jgi:two-component system, LytTR family, response regulator